MGHRPATHLIPGSIGKALIHSHTQPFLRVHMAIPIPALGPTLASWALAEQEQTAEELWGEGPKGSLWVQTWDPTTLLSNLEEEPQPPR